MTTAYPENQVTSFNTLKYLTSTLSWLKNKLTCLNDLSVNNKEGKENLTERRPFWDQRLIMEVDKLRPNWQSYSTQIKTMRASLHDKYACTMHMLATVIPQLTMIIDNLN